MRNSEEGWTANEGERKNEIIVRDGTVRKDGPPMRERGRMK